MDFKEFYQLLNEAITKDKSNVTPSDENFNIYLMNRYLSFYHSEIAIHIAKTTNRLGFIPDDEDAYYCIKGILPKLPKSFINYVKKPAVLAAQECDFDEEEIYNEARLHECSKREIRNMILEKDNYAKRSRKRKAIQ